MDAFEDDFVEIRHKRFRFLISKNPVNKRMQSYIKELKNRNINVVIRTCRPSYDPRHLFNAGIQMAHLPARKPWIRFFNILKEEFYEGPANGIVIHCVAGLGRAPLLVAIALIELGYAYEDAVEMIRAKRRGAINLKQLNFLANYKPKSRLKATKKTSCNIQ
ncbi:hypothetical protein NQ315_006741 [Exocentrus adspersus]|uniref:Protein tyrosine phosphatase type IVA 3 n=1 Tax=Exocentrus adspersus TaxID=1586481 RepID=A0AAV8WBD7_9CUCU|nr:hypothetical protein NQ315_006741 [Exocentrus adspersus]